jgi:hypothetical protein
MKKIVRQEGKKIWLDTDNDQMVYDGVKAHRHRMHGQGNSATRGIDLYAHECTDGGRVYYCYHWTLWQGESNYIEEITLDEARQFIEQNIDVFDDSEIAGLEELELLDLNEVE